MNLRGFVTLVGVVGGLASIVGVVPILRHYVSGDAKRLTAVERVAIAAELRRVAADGHVSADERAGLGELLANLDVDEEAAASYVAEIEPAVLRAAEELREGLRLATSGRFAEARRRFAEAARLDAGHPAAWANLGGAALEEGAIVEAERASRRALELDARSVAAHYNLGACLARQERLEPALDHLARALDLVIDGASEPIDRKSLLADLRRSPHFASLRALPPFTELVRRLEHAGG